MNILIIEDEQPAVKRLNKVLAELLPDSRIVGTTDSISGTEAWLAVNAMPDLAFVDIHLADGSSFDLLRRNNISFPIIFTTAYDEYAMEAFKTSGIDYLLKPVKKEELEGALKKLNNLRAALTTEKQQQSTQPVTYKKRFMIRYGEHIKTVTIEEIAYCYSEHKATYARTLDARTYPLDMNLDALEAALDPQHFFRVNRQYIICLKAIKEMKIFTKGRVIITLQPDATEQPIVSSERAAEFKKWLDDEIS